MIEDLDWLRSMESLVLIYGGQDSFLYIQEIEIHTKRKDDCPKKTNYVNTSSLDS